ncbi:Dps family protein [Bryobacter aggregatus]|uniref:Dps family protein n=1 Tax=Bryobacter aggregatus TaxID=360054 RepID=UPI0004E24BAE|nr:DNA starvation/stationary phase protection protein [Bryobacter aggregatus]
MGAIQIGLTDDQRAGSAGLLKAALADVYVLYTKTRKYHWNVEGTDFHDLHKFFESQYEELDTAIDEIAERIRALGVYSTGSFKEFLEDARIKEDSNGQISAMQMIENLLNDQEAIIRDLRIDIKRASSEFDDDGNADFLTGLLKSHEKMAWMLRSMLR